MADPTPTFWGVLAKDMGIPSIASGVGVGVVALGTGGAVLHATNDPTIAASSGVGIGAIATLWRVSTYLRRIWATAEKSRIDAEVARQQESAAEEARRVVRAAEMTTRQTLRDRLLFQTWHNQDVELVMLDQIWTQLGMPRPSPFDLVERTEPDAKDLAAALGLTPRPAPASGKYEIDEDGELVSTRRPT